MFIAGLIFLNAFASTEVSAQTMKAIRADVPFDFRLGDQVYPAGVYYLESISQLSDNLLQLRSFETKKQRLLATDDFYTGKQQSPKLVFYRIGEEYYLTNIFMTQGVSGFLIRSSRRIESGKNLASTKRVEVPVKN